MSLALRRRGFTLLEVMIALAILGAGLTMLLTATAANVAKSLRAQDVAIAAELGRGKMYDLEEQLLEEGFQELNQEEEGDFSDEGWPDVKWSAEIVKIELPGVDALAAGGGGDGQDGGEASGAGAGGLLGGVFGGGGEDGEGTAAGASMFGALYEPIRSIAEMAIRKVTLTVTWRVAGNDETLVLDCYFTDPNAIQQAIPFLGGGGTAASGSGSSTSGGSGSSSTSGSGSGGGGGGGGGTSPSPTRAGGR